MITKNGIIQGKEFNESLQNIKTNGTVVISDNGIASGFSLNNYFYYDNNTTNILGKIKLEYSVMVSQYVNTRWMGNNQAGGLLTMGIDDNGYVLYGNLGSANTTSTYKLPKNQKVYFKLEPSNSKISIYYSTDKTTWNLLSNSCTTSSTAYPIFFGRGYNNYFSGKMDLKDFVVKDLNDNIIYAPAITNTNQNIVIVGNPTVKEDGRISNFSLNDYVYTPSVNLNTESWEIRNLRFKTATLGSGFQPILSGLDSGPQKLMLGISSSNLTVGFSSTGNSWDIAGDKVVMAVSANTVYNVDLIFDGTSYNVYVDDVLKNTFNSSNKIYTASTTSLYLGIHRLKTSYYNSEIDISDLTINNGNEVYNSLKNKATVSDYQFSSTEFYEI